MHVFCSTQMFFNYYVIKDGYKVKVCSNSVDIIFNYFYILLLGVTSNANCTKWRLIPDLLLTDLILTVKWSGSQT